MMEELQTVELQINKRRYMLLGLYPLVLATGYVLIPNIVPYAWLKWSFVVFCIGIGLWFLSDVFIGNPYLKITVQGIETRRFFRTRKIRWLDIARFYEPNRKHALGFVYVQDRTPKPSAFNRNFFGYDDTVVNSSTLKFDEFRDLVISYWTSAKQIQALELSKQTLNPRLKAD